MRIDAYNQIQQIYQTSNVKKTQDKKTTATSFRDQLMLSRTAQDAQTAKKALADVPDVREELTVPLKEAIDNGTYDVDVDDFAGKLLEKYNGLF